MFTFFKVQRSMMTDRDGHWWDEDRTTGWSVEEKNGRWMGQVHYKGEVDTIYWKDTRKEAMTAAINDLKRFFHEFPEE